MLCIVKGDKSTLPKGTKIKYRLPMLDSCVIDADDSAIDKISELYPCTFVSSSLNRAREIVNCNRHGYSGKGISIAVLDTGVCKSPDFDKRILVFKDMINHKQSPYDDNGHGTHVCGILCGSGLQSSGVYEGIAPSAGIAMIKTLDKDGSGSSSDVLAGMQWVADNYKRYSIRILNMSIGSDNTSVYDPLVRAAEKLWQMGIVVVVAAGNNGPAPRSVSSPGISKRIITVGACEGNDTGYSGRGPTSDCIIKPDLVAPGQNIVSCRCGSEPYKALSGTSMSTPIVSGAIALLLEKDPTLKPDDVKYMLKLSSTDLSISHNAQGWGMLNIDKLLTMESRYVDK
jgi:serine protease AprX